MDDVPATICGMRFVEMASWGIQCSADHPGVPVSPLDIGSAGDGTAPVQQSVMPGAAGEWISVDRRFLLGGEQFDGAC